MSGDPIASESTPVELTAPEVSIANSTQEVVQAENVTYAGDIWLHRIFLAMASAVIAMSFLMSSNGETKVYLPGSTKPMPETCSSKRLFGIDCPGCGMTRAFISISHGEFAKAWNFNGASFLVYAFVIVQIPWHIMQLWRIKNGKYPLQLMLVYFFPIAIAIALIVNWIFRILPNLGYSIT